MVDVRGTTLFVGKRIAEDDWDLDDSPITEADRNSVEKLVFVVHPEDENEARVSLADTPGLSDFIARYPSVNEIIFQSHIPDDAECRILWNHGLPLSVIGFSDGYERPETGVRITNEPGRRLLNEDETDILTAPLPVTLTRQLGEMGGGGGVRDPWYLTAAAAPPAGVPDPLEGLKPNLTQHTRTYIEGFANRESFSSQLEGLELTEEEERVLRDQYSCPISLSVMDIPLRLHEHYFDAVSLGSLRDMRNPMSNEAFDYAEIGSARLDKSVPLQAFIDGVKARIAAENRADVAASKDDDEHDESKDADDELEIDDRDDEPRSPGMGQ